MKKHNQEGSSIRELSAYLAALGGDEETAALSALCAAAKKKTAAEYIDRHIDRGRLHAALKSEKPKTRKNAARLIGALQNPLDEEALIVALAGEETRLVRPSVILALGALGGERAAGALNAYAVEDALTPEEDKHVREEREALRRARAAASPMAIPRFTGFPAPQPAVLLTPDGFSQMLMEELDAYAIPSKQMGASAVQLYVQDMEQLFRSRCFSQLLFPLAASIAPDPAAVAKAVHAPLLRLLRSCHEGFQSFPYRVEYGAAEDRAAFISALVPLLDTDGLTNSPSAYGAELRLMRRRDGRLQAYCKLTTIEDTRFAYRRQSLPASIAPATAACIARYAASFAPGAYTILDPCCGSGTLLIEWAKLCPDSKLTGVDIAPPALEAARENSARAHVKLGLVHQDLKKFTAQRPYDLVLANLPFGNRVGSHKENERLYAALAENLPRWLAPGGIALLYTMEYTLLKAAIASVPALRRIAGTRTGAGGLMPQIIVVAVE